VVLSSSATAISGNARVIVVALVPKSALMIAVFIRE